MKTKLMAFDIETAKVVEGRSFSLEKERPLGITCLATLKSDEPNSRVWVGRNSDDTISPRMEPHELSEVVDFLEDAVAGGYTIVTWNGLGFDFDVLAEESGEIDRCRELAKMHIDMLYHVFCEKGFPVSLAKAAQGLGVDGKAAGMDGMQAPILWAAGKHQQVMDYVQQDARATLDVAVAATERKALTWITAKGRPSSMPLRNGWLSAADAQALPVPDTSWMDRPISRSQFDGWLTRQ